MITNILIVTAYCICTTCCGPHAKGITKSGKIAKPGIHVAAPRSVPFGTKIYIPEVGTRIVEDRLARRYNNRIDILMSSHKKAKNFGIKKLPVLFNY